MSRRPRLFNSSSDQATSSTLRGLRSSVQNTSTPGGARMSGLGEDWVDVKPPNQMVLETLRGELRRNLDELQRVNGIAQSQDAEITFLRGRLEDVVKQCNEQAYLIHALQEKLKIERSLASQSILSLGEEEHEREDEDEAAAALADSYVAKLLSDNRWDTQGRELEMSSARDAERRKLLEIERENERLKGEKDLLMGEILALREELGNSGSRSHSIRDELDSLSDDDLDV